MFRDDELLEMAPASTRANPSGQQQWGPYRQQQQHSKPWAPTRHLPSSSSLFSERSWDPDVHTIYSPRDPKFRTSSPGPLAQYRAANFPEEDISSVLLPSSVERSFPTGTQSSGIHSQLSPLSSPPLEPSNRGVFSPNYELPALKILHTHLPNIEEEEALSDGYRRTLPEDNYDYPPIRRPIPVAWYPNYHQLEVEEEDDEPPPRPPRYTVREPPPRPLEPPPPVPDIKQREMPRRQLDVYKRIQAQDEDSPLATSSPPRLDRRIARVPPSPASGMQPSPLTMDDQGSPHTYSPVEGLTLVRPHGGGGRYNVTERHTHFGTGPLHHLVANVAVPTPEVTPRVMTLNDGEGDSTMTSDEAFHALGVTPSGRMSVASAGTGSSGRGSKPASVSHSRGDSLQGELQEYSPTSRSSSSGFASRNTSQSQSSPHGVGGGGVSRSLPSRPQPSLNVSTDENYEFDSVSPLDLQAAGEQVTGAREENPAEEEGDGEAEGAGAQAIAGKYDDVEIERRIPALKQEFQQFRRRQRERLNDDLMESEC